MPSVFVVVGRGALAVAVAVSLASCSITIKRPGEATTTAAQAAVSTQASSIAASTASRAKVAAHPTTTHAKAAKHAPGKAPASRSTVAVSVGPPRFPGPYFHPGDVSPTIKIFQDEMHARGYFPVGTGDYGPNTLAMVKRLQAQNGLIPNGEIGPNTWRLAWTGTYNPDTTVQPTPADFSCTIGQDPTTLDAIYQLSGPSSYSGTLTIEFLDPFGDQFDPTYLGPGSQVTGVWRDAPSSTTGGYESPTSCTAT